MARLLRLGPLMTFAISRALLALLAVAAVVGFAGHLNPERSRWDSPRLHDLGVAIDVWARWDSDWFLRIAESWYDWPSSTPAFFPLYPALVGALTKATGGHGVLAGVVVSASCAAGAFVLLHRLVRERWDRELADRSIVLLAVFPTSLFLTAVYSESLFLLLAVAVFVLAERGRLWEAALVAGLALLTRSQGAALLPALALFGWRAAGARRATVLPAVALGIFALYPLALWVSIDRPFAFVTAQRTVWGRSFDPLEGIAGIGRAIAAGHILEVGSLVVMAPLAVVAWRRLGATYGSYAASVLLMPIAFPSMRFGSLYSYPRLCLAAFPCVVALALVARAPAILWPTVIGSAALLCVLTVRWSLWEWVA